MKVIYTTQKIEENQNSIFLAGPSPRSDDVQSWRPEAIQLLADKGFDGVVYNSEHVDGQEGFNKSEYPPDWEWHAINQSGVLAFWVPRDMETMPALTTNVEFGYWMKGHPFLLYGRPDGAPKNRYLDWLLKKERPSAPIYKNLNDLMESSTGLLNLLKELYEDKKIVR